MNGLLNHSFQYPGFQMGGFIGLYNTDEKIINVKQYKAALELHKTDNLNVAIHDFLIRQIFPRDIKPEIFVFGNEEKQEPETNMLQDMEIWKVILEKVLTEIWVLGIVVIDLSQDPPQILSETLGERYIITVRESYVTNKKEFRVYRKKNKYEKFEYDPNIQILDGFGYDPLFDGTLTSIGASVLRSEEMWALNDNLALNAAYNNSHRPIFYSGPNASGEDIFEQAASEEFSGLHGRHTAEGRKHGHMLENNFDNYTTFSGSVIAATFDIHRRYQEETKLWSENWRRIGNHGVVPQTSQTYPLPPNARIENQVSSIIRDDMEEQNRRREDYILSPYGLMHIDMFSTKSHKVGSTATAQNTSRLLSDTINRWRSIIGRVYTVFMHTGGRNQGFKCTCKTDIDVYDMVKEDVETPPSNFNCQIEKYCISFKFPLMPILRGDEVIKLSEEGYLEEDVLKITLSQATGIPEGQIIMPMSKKDQLLEMEKLKHTHLMEEIKLQMELQKIITQARIGNSSSSSSSSSSPPPSKKKRTK